MKISLMIPPCVRCLQVCPNCQHLPIDKRRRQAEAALMLLKEKFPGLVPDWPGEPDGPEKER
jgi:hypothetical protein